MDNQIRVDMTPNPLDLKTLHCSQGDTEARTFKFELHNNGENVDVSGVREQIAFKAYKGGTEQLLPENTSTPTTSPFLGDIKYPQWLLTDQEFTYRESPTESDGLAKITDIKGNTLVWNQLVPISTRATATTSGITFTNNNDGSVKASGTASALAIFNYANANAINIKSGHKYLLKGCPSGGGDSTYQVSLRASSGSTQIGNDVGNGILFTASNDYTNCALYLRVVSGATINVTFKPCLFDLTQMGLDFSSPSDFTSLFSLPYYAYSQGTLLSFNGNGIKTVGFNQWDEEWEVGSISPTNGTNANVGTNRIRSKNYIPCLPNTQYSLWNGDGVYSYMYFYDGNKNFIGMGSIINANPKVDTTPSNCAYIRFRTNDNTDAVYNNNICLNISDTSKNGTYEPYTSSTLSLPISTYFPTGMKRAGNVYDELTPNKAITRLIKTVVDGTNKTATYYGVFNNHHLFYIDLFATTYVDVSNMTNLKTNHYLTASSATMDDRYIRYQTVAYPNINIGRIYWNDDRYTSASAMNTALQADPLEIISLAQTPTETQITTASLVTENAEIPLSNEDGVLIGKCTEQLSAEPGFHDAKIKLSDSDGECYSNKIQLHVERSPQ